MGLCIGAETEVSGRYFQEETERAWRELRSSSGIDGCEGG